MAQSMKHYAPFCQIIFLSSYLSYATEVYETEHIYFILKSQLHQRIGPALHQALTALGDRSVQITAQKDGSTHVIALQDVLYLERNLRKTKVITQQGVFLTQESPETLISGSGRFRPLPPELLGKSQTCAGDRQQPFHHGQRIWHSDQPHLSSGGQTAVFT